MSRTKLLQEIRKMKFGDIYHKWCVSYLTQDEAALLLAVSTRTFRRYCCKHSQKGSWINQMFTACEANPLI